MAGHIDARIISYCEQPESLDRPVKVAVKGGRDIVVQTGGLCRNLLYAIVLLFHLLLIMFLCHLDLLNR